MAYVSPRRLALALLVAAGAAAAAPLAACPPQQGRALLDSATVFDGEPEKKLELQPNFANLEWDLSADQQEARARGEAIHLVCKYKSSKSIVTIRLAYEATLCKAEGIKHRTVVSCSAAPKTPTKE
ncbi:MAG: STY0301 family protein [Pseudomonadota bacterium]